MFLGLLCSPIRPYKRDKKPTCPESAFALVRHLIPDQTLATKEPQLQIFVLTCYFFSERDLLVKGREKKGDAKQVC